MGRDESSRLSIVVKLSVSAAHTQPFKDCGT